MKILQVTPRYHPYIGGVEEHVKTISERLAKKHDITVFTCDPSATLPKTEEINQVTVNRFYSFAPQEAYYFSPAMISALKRAAFDVVHAHNYHAFPLFFSAWTRAHTFVVTPHYHGHGHTPVRNLLLRGYRPLGRIALRKAHTIVCVSQYEKSLLKTHFNIEDKKMVVIPNGVDTKEFEQCKKWNPPQNTKKILCVSRLEKYKGIHHIIDAVARLDATYHLDIVGTGSYKKELVTLAKNLHVQERVTFSESLPREILVRKYCEASVFVLLSAAEAYSISVAEALASKTPCIVADTSALSEWIDNTTCFGIGYPVNNDTLVQCIKKVSGVPVSQVTLPTWEETVEKLELVYKSYV